MSRKSIKYLLVILFFTFSFAVLFHSVAFAQVPTNIQVNETVLGFHIPTLGDILTFAIRAFFVIAGITALIFLLLGAFSWITSGGDKEEVGKAQQKIQAALLGVILIAVVLALVVTLEQVVFKGTICFGISCPVKIPGLVESCEEAYQNGTPCQGDTTHTLAHLGQACSIVPPKGANGTPDSSGHPPPCESGLVCDTGGGTDGVCKNK